MFEVIGWSPIIIGMLVATVSAALAIRWLVAFLTKHGLAVFGYYRLVLAAVLAGLIAMGTVSLHSPSDPVLETPATPATTDTENTDG
jgi:undecaprenyl-diphosphatase